MHMLCALITLLYCGVLAYCTYKVVVEWCLPAERWGVTVAINASEDMLNNRNRHLSLLCCFTTS